jgi:DNA-binding GntR family transcriptional regulator
MKKRPTFPSPAAGKARVVRGVVRGLLKGQWAGGDRLTEVETAELFQVSRTPVREALLELASMGIIELKRNCGAVFRPFGAKELMDLYAVRSLLEVEAARLAAKRISNATLEELIREFEALLRSGKPDTGWRLDLKLHGAVAEAAGNPRLADEIARYRDLVQTMRETVGTTLANVHGTSVKEHLAILDQLQTRDPAGAAEAMRLHLLQAANSALEALPLISGSSPIPDAVSATRLVRFDGT